MKSKLTLRSLGLLVLVFFSAYALARSRGTYSTTGVGLYLLTLCLGLFVIFRFTKLGAKFLPLLAGKIAIFALFWVHLQLQPESFRILYPEDVGLLYSMSSWVAILPFAGLVIFLFLLERIPTWFAWIFISAIFALLLVPLVMVIPVSPKPYIDVWYIYQEASGQLLAGLNPYTTEYTNLYPDSPRYPEGKADIYAYPPLTIFANLIGYLFGDVRWGMLGCHFLGSLLIFATGVRGKLPVIEAFAIAGMALAVPFNHFVIEQSWNEPYIVLALACFVFLMREGRTNPALIAAGFAIALKQTMILFLPFFLFHWRKWDLKKLILFGGLSAITYGSFALLDFSAMYHDIVIHFRQTPFRPDSLSILAYLHNEGFVTFDAPPNSISFFILIGGILGGSFCIWKAGPGDPFAPQRLSFFLLVFAVVYLIFVLGGKQAFTNYFYLFHIVLVLAFLFARLADTEKQTVG